jgi:hypothetical protein
MRQVRQVRQDRSHNQQENAMAYQPSWNVRGWWEDPEKRRKYEERVAERTKKLRAKRTARYEAEEKTRKKPEKTGS